jgi:hypothetical protein
MNFLTIFFLFCNLIFAGDYSNFKNITSKDAKYFAADIGGLAGSGVSYTARSLGFSGFDVSFKTAYQIKPSKDNKVMDKDRSFGLNMTQVEIGMPYRIDTFIRGGFGDKIALVGGGMKYGLWKIKDDLYFVNGDLVLNTNMINNPDFYLIQYGAQIFFSMNCGAVRPYLGFGFDSSKLNIQNANDSSLIDKEYTNFKERATLGLRLKMKWFNLATAYNYLHGENGVEGSLGIRF